MRHFLVLISLVGAVSACAAPSEDSTRLGQDFIGANGLRVVPQADPAEFEVVARPGSAGADFFCAAAGYGRVRLSAPPTARIVLTRPVGPSVDNPGGRSVFMRIVPGGAAPERSGISVSMRKQGENLSIGHGKALCTNDRFGLFDDDFL